MMKRILSLVIGLAFCFSTAIASASLTVGYTGTYTSDDGITGYGGWSTDVTFAWDVTNNGDGTYTYKYDWTTAQKNLSHLNIQVSDGFSGSDVSDWSVMPKGTGGPYLPYQCATDINKNFDGNTWNAFKFDNLEDHPEATLKDYTLTLTTNRMPMDGNFYAKDGKNTYAHNTDGFSIAVPNSAVPIPSAILLLGAGLIGLVGFRRKKIAK